MDLVNSILNFIKSKGTAEEQETPENLCPNCWGREEYGGHFYERLEQANLDINSSGSEVGWINEYANKHLAGIAMKRTGNREETICYKCNVTYQQTDNNS